MFKDGPGSAFDDESMHGAFGKKSELVQKKNHEIVVINIDEDGGSQQRPLHTARAGDTHSRSFMMIQEGGA
jgi:hypothetical protein